MSLDAQHKAFKIAVFDLDGTSIDAQSGALFSKYLFMHGYLSFRCALHLISWGLRYKLRLPHSQVKPREAIFMELTDLPSQQVDDIMYDFYQEVISSKFRAHAIDEVKRLKSEGYIVLLVSATFEGIARAAGKYLGVDDVIATVMERGLDGEYTGRVQGDSIEGAAKPAAVIEWANKHLGKGNWTIECAYGDHYSDEKLLESARRAYAVCPGSVLKHKARKHGWTVLEWD